MLEEWKQMMKSNWLRMVMVAIMIIPAAYACIFLGSMWDPYGNTDQIPVAVVNQDIPVPYQSKKMHLGDDLASNLKTNKSMDFQFTTKKQAEAGLKKGTYYMIITIPKDFSKNATTLLNEHPKQMVMHYTTNPGTNYIAAKMDESAINKIKAKVSASVTSNYAKTLFDQVDTLSSGLQDASTGSLKLASGTDQLIQGNTSLHDNLQVLAQSTLRFQDGSSTMENGLQTYVAGVSQLTAGTVQLYNQNERLNSGVTSLGNGIITAKTGSFKLLNGMQSISSALSANFTAEKLQGLETLQKLNTESAQQMKVKMDNLKAANMNAIDLLGSLDQSDPAVKTAKGTLQANNQAFDELYPKIAQLNAQNYATINSLSTSLLTIQSALDSDQGLINGMKQLDGGLSLMDTNVNGNNGLIAGIKQYTKGVHELNIGANQLSNNNRSLLNGMAQLDSGTSAIHSGAEQLADGSATLGNGLTTLQSGSKELQGKLQDGADKSTLTIDSATIKMMSEPLITNHQEMYQVKNNGHAMAPYMMSVGINVACMAFTLMYPLMKNGKETKSGFQLWLNKASVMFTLSTLMAILMVSSLIMINGMQPAHVMATYLIAILIAAAFMSMVVFFNITCGKIGAFIVLIFMVFQLGGAAGTYPIETSNAFYNAIHPFMPFTYSVDAFRHTIAMNGDIRLDIIVFIGILFFFSMLSILFYKWRVKMSDEAFEKTRLAQYH